MAAQWFEKTYRRNVVDMHITADDERFMTEFDPVQYVDMLALSQAQSAVVYAHSHVGLCFFPTQVGPMHPGLKGRDILGEVIDLCHKRGIHVVVYYSLIYDTYAYRHNADWRIIGPNGKGVADESRYGVCCPNAPYRDYAAAMARELATHYEFEGIRFDMTFWPAVCYCQHCRERFAQQVGGGLPRIIDWGDPHWVSFQRKREEWLAEFAAFETAAVKGVKPDVTVEHQASTYPANWRFGVTARMAPHNDFLQGDFYGDALQGSFARKLFYNLSPARPAAFETSIGIDLRNYTALKTEALLTCKASAALADACAFVFIDSIDPVGTLNRTVYERMGRIFDRTKPYEPYLGGELCQDVAVYLSTESKGDPADNGKPVDDPHLSPRMPHVDAAVSVCKSLIESHIPFGVITTKNLGELSRHQVVVLPDVLMLDDDEVVAFREYVRRGGRLYASKYTSLIRKDGRRQADFLLADVFGASCVGETQETFTYIAPTPETLNLFVPYTEKHPAGLYGRQLLLEAKPGVKVLGELVLPYTDPADPFHFASIHNNPPGIRTGRPAIVLNHFGQGQAMYVAGDLENADPHRGVFVSLIRLLAKPFSFEAEAPKAVEVTAFRQEGKRRTIVSLVNFQKDLPNIPVEGIKVRVRLDGKAPRRLLALPSESPLAYQVQGDCIEFVAPRLETLAMFALDYA
jgi:hypothetical protein